VKDVPTTNAMDLRPPRFNAKRILVTSFFCIDLGVIQRGERCTVYIDGFYLLISSFQSFLSIFLNLSV
jgi:hypothetical protein